MTLDNLKIVARGGIVRDVTFNGKPLRMLKRIDCVFDANDTTQAQVTLSVDILEIEIEGQMQVILDDETKSTLLSLGWTPPEET